PQEHDWRSTALPHAILHGDELWILIRSLRDAQERSHLLALHLAPPEHRHLELVPTTDLGRRLCKVVGRAEVPRHLRESPRDLIAGGDGFTAREGVLCGLGVVRNDDHPRERLL